MAAYAQFGYGYPSASQVSAQHIIMWVEGEGLFMRSCAELSFLELATHWNSERILIVICLMKLY